MSSNWSRLVTPDDLPDSLWNPSEHLLELPPLLVSAYTAILDQHDLREVAKNRPPNEGPVGGIGEKETDEHLAWAFPGSAARVELAVLDPQNRIPHVADLF